MALWVTDSMEATMSVSPGKNGSWEGTRESGSGAADVNIANIEQKCGTNIDPSSAHFPYPVT
jgi:hypothetical protein